MRALWSILFFIFFSYFNSFAQQRLFTGNNPNWHQLGGGFGDTIPYPSKINISGALPYVVGVEVSFPSIFINTSLQEYDFLLESPSGRRVMLFSDFHESGFTDTFKVSSFAAQQQDNWDRRKPVLPGNFGTAADTFPAPGPGIIQPGKATFVTFVNDNPNGTWKLWIVDDTKNGSYISLSRGWSLNILTSPVPVCQQPELPIVSDITDSTAVLRWQGHTPPGRWDILWQPSNLNNPDENTPASVQNLSSAQFLIENLPPDKKFSVFVRTVCANGTRSFWMGPVQFRTLFTPCLHTIPIAACQKVDCEKFPSYSILPFTAGCEKKQPQWVFRFTAPESGPYWVNYEEYNSGTYTTLNWLPDTFPSCPQKKWKCLSQKPNDPFSRIFDTLVAGRSYFLMFENGFTPPKFRISRCPLPNLRVEQDLSLSEPFNATIRFIGTLGNTPSTFDLYYTANPTAAEPGNNTLPTEANIVINPAQDIRYRLKAPGITASSKYRIWVRNTCGSGSSRSCWVGPFTFETALYCGVHRMVRFDSITGNSAILRFIAPSRGYTSYKIIVNKQNFATGQIATDSAGQQISFKLKGLDPEVRYEVQLNAFCWPNGTNNPWYSHFFSTSKGCFMPVQELVCGQTLHNLHFSGSYPKYFYHAGCTPGYNDANEYLYRLTATKTRTLLFSRGLGSGGGEVRIFMKSDTLGCNRYGFQSRGCLTQGTTIPVDSGQTYLILIKGFRSGSRDFYQSLGLTNCLPDCPKADSIWVDAKTTTSATLRWRNVSPGSTYIVHAWSVFLREEITRRTTDTTIVFNQLAPSNDYIFTIETVCANGVPRTGVGKFVSLGKQLFRQTVSIGRCNPRFTPPGKQHKIHYEVLDLKVPQSGTYLLSAKRLNSYLYNGSFNPDAPALNLMAVVDAYSTFGADTVLALEAGKTYQWVVADTAVVSNRVFNIPGKVTYEEEIFTDGPAKVSLLAPRWNNLTPAPHGKVPYLGSWSHSGLCADTAGWIHYYYRPDNNPNSYDDDHLLFSIKTKVPATQMQSMPMTFSSLPGPVKMTKPPAQFFQNPDGIFEMNRIWYMKDLAPPQQINQDFLIRFYYTEQEFQQLKAKVNAEGGKMERHEDMYFYKINGFHSTENISPASQHLLVPAATAYNKTGYWPYKNGPEATSSTWRHGTYGGEHYAEMLIQGFSGGGGGATVNGKSVFDMLSKAIGLNASGLFSLYPNPNTGLFTIELPEPARKDTHIRVLDITGRIQLEQPAQTGIARQTVDAAALPSGMYFLEVLEEGRVRGVAKFVKCF